jgi:hypothetical protein
MLTDLPELAITEINATLQLLGFTAIVLTHEQDQHVVDLGKVVFKNARAIVDSWIQQMKVGATIYVCLIIDEDKDFQACAMRLGADEYCIAIWLAVPLRTSTMTSRLLCTDACAKLFNISPPGYPKPSEPLGLDTFVAYKALSFQAGVDLGGELDEFRKYLDFVAFEWLVLHELGHIVNGHLAVGRSLNGLTYILEDNASDSRDENLTSQTLEMDADSFATLLSIQNAMRRKLPLETKEMSLPIVTSLRIKSFVFAIMTIIRSFDEAAFEQEAIFDLDHPPGGVRMRYLIGLISTMFVEKAIEFDGVEVPDIAAEALIGVEAAIAEATGLKSGGGNLLRAFEMGWDVYHVPLLSRWALLFDQLNEVKINPFKLAPPQYPPA